MKLRDVRFPDSVISRLVVVTLLAGLVTGIIGVTLVWVVETRDLRRDAAARNVARAERQAVLIDSRIQVLRSQLEFLATVPAVASLSSDANEELAVAIRVSDDLDELVLFDARGEPVAGAASSRLVDINEVASRPELRDVQHPAVALATDGELPEIEYLLPVQDPPGQIAGTLVARVPLDAVSQEAEGRLRGIAATASVVADDGTIVGHPDLSRVLRRERFPVLDDLRDTRSLIVVRGGERVVVAAAPSSQFAGWVVMEQTETEALAPLSSSLEEITAVFVAVIAAVVLGVILVGRRILQPLGPMADAVVRLGHGDLDARVATRGSGEVAVLAEGFNQMATSLQERQRELEAAERAARRSEQRLRLLIEGVEDYAIVLLGLSGQIRSWNSGARRVLGAETDDVLGSHFGDFVATEPSEDDPFRTAAKEGRSEREGWMRRHDGDRFWAQLSLVALVEEDGTPYGYAAVVHDLTERHATQEALETALEREQQAADELRRTNEAKSEFLAIAAHELQTPLAAILGANGILSDADDLDDDERERLNSLIGTHAEIMRHIVERLLDLSRLHTGRVQLSPEPIDVRSQLEGHVDLLRGQLSRHEVVLDAPSITVVTDAAALRHIVTNLLSNAAKFSRTGSTIEVVAQVVDGHLHITVADEGIGIDDADRDRIFELFRQSQHGLASAQGTGVGLAIVRRYAELLGGTVAVDSEPGRGSRFRVRLPVNVPRGQLASGTTRLD